MGAAWTLVLIMTAAMAPPVHAINRTGSARHAPTPALNPANKMPNVELEIAKKYATLSDWTQAEAHFVVAAKDPDNRTEALAGLEQARRKVDEAQNAVLAVGQRYEDAEMWSKAEDIYRPAASDRSLGEETRKQIAGRLAQVVAKQDQDRSWTEAKEWLDRVTMVVAYLVIVFALILAGATCSSIAARRAIVLIRPFAAPTDEVVRSLAIHLKYAREMMRNPALAPAGPLPTTLVTMMLFADETEPIEDLELAGSKIPFTALAKLFGKPCVEVGGSFDGVAPLGNAFATIETRGGWADDFAQHAIRVGVPDQQRQDLLDFAYDVIRKARTAHALL